MTRKKDQPPRPMVVKGRTGLFPASAFDLEEIERFAVGASFDLAPPSKEGRSGAPYRRPSGGKPMTDKPMIFSGAMVRAILEGRKSQTRRNLPLAHPRHPDCTVLNPDLLVDKRQVWFWDGVHDGVGASWTLPYAPGDRLWVREAWCTEAQFDDDAPSDLLNSARVDFAETYHERPGIAPTWGGRYRNALHMPRWASRLTLTVTDVRVQRLQEISEGDAFCEGVGQRVGASCRDDFADLWTRIHGPDAWAANPWVAAISFETRRGNIDQMENACD